MAVSCKFVLPETRKQFDPAEINRFCTIVQPVEALDGMNKKFTTPYVIFYPVVSRDGMPFPVNKCIREIQGSAFKEGAAWRGNIVIAKYRDDRFSNMTDASMADFPLLKNYLSTHYSPAKVSIALPLDHEVLRSLPNFFHCGSRALCHEFIEVAGFISFGWYYCWSL